MAETQTTTDNSRRDRFLVSARKYRPQTFGDLVAQEHVTATLRNAIRLDRLAHAYLFSGPRGVGKTTAARLLAKAINCQTPLDEREDAEPCRTCDACRSFEEGRDLNVIEIDAASNRKIEDVRDLRETVRIPPQGARKKVYILDEIHMLTKEAFNALLKTLEEPPGHALFIFATTEPHKVLPTILSRCQRFDFRRITVDETVGHLREISEIEEISADDGALHLIARRADGALRDALSLFDQAVALCGREIRYEELAHQLGVVDRDLFFEVTTGAWNGRSAQLLQLIDNVVRRGYDLAEFLGGLIEHLRHLYVIATTGTAVLIEADEGTRSRYLDAGRDRSEADLLRAMLVVEEAEQRLRTSPQPRLVVELALLRLAHLEPVEDLTRIIRHIEKLEGNLGSSGDEKAPEQAGKPEARAVPQKEAAAPPRPQPTTTTAETAPAYDAPEKSSEPSPPKPPPSGSSGPDDGPPPPAPPTPSPSVAPAARSVEDDSTEWFGKPALKRRGRPGGDTGGNGSVATASATTTIEDEHFGAALGKVRDAWPQLLDVVGENSPAVATVLALSRASGVHAGSIIVAVPDDFSHEVLRREEKVFSDALRQALGEEPPPFIIQIQADAQETAPPEDPFETIKRLRHEHPTLRFLFERFGAEIVWT